MQPVPPPDTEEVTVSGPHLLATVEHLIHEGNVRRIVIVQDGATIAEFPLTIGLVGALLAPALAAIGAIAALVTDCTMRVERVPAVEAPPTRAG
jgi:hypothetical protein